jgi:hypothetical protein
MHGTLAHGRTARTNRRQYPVWKSRNDRGIFAQSAHFLSVGSPPSISCYGLTEGLPSRRSVYDMAFVAIGVTWLKAPFAPRPIHPREIYKGAHGRPEVCRGIFPAVPGRSRWLSAAGNEHLTIQSRCRAVASSSSSLKMPATTLRSFRKPSMRPQNGKPRWKP